MKGVRSLVNI